MIYVVIQALGCCGAGDIKKVIPVYIPEIMVNEKMCRSMVKRYLGVDPDKCVTTWRLFKDIELLRKYGEIQH